MRNSIMAPPIWEQEKWERKRKEFWDKCKKEDEENPPQDTAEQVGRFVWRTLTCPRDPRIF